MSDATPTARFRRQHAELAALAGELMKLLDDRAALEGDPSAVRRALAVLAGKLKVHAAMEDEALYPRLTKHPDPELRALAASLHADFGHVYKGFVSYLEQWDAQSIAARPDDFVAATRATMRSLGQRMKVENETLYARVDALEAEGG